MLAQRRGQPDRGAGYRTPKGISGHERVARVLGRHKDLLRELHTSEEETMPKPGPGTVKGPVKKPSKKK